MNQHFLEVHGLTQDHLDQFENKQFHKLILKDIEQLKSNLKRKDVELLFASTYRSFEAQLTIFNEKAKGIRKITDDQNEEVLINNLSEEEILFKILRFSAIPGFSRHHWGTDFDIYFKVENEHKLKLESWEYEKTGPFYQQMKVLKKFSLDQSFDFFWPYEKDFGGLANEPWHISHIETSKEYQESLTIASFTSFIENNQEIQLKEAILDNKNIIFDKYITLQST